MNGKTPTIVIINGANWLGSKLVDSLISSDGNVIVVDDFKDQAIPFIKHYSNNKKFVFIEKDKIDSLQKNFTQIKYFIHLKNDFDTKDDDISSKHFIKETQFIDNILTIALEKKSAYILVSSLHLHKDFMLRKNYIRNNPSNSAYTESDLQDYIERTVIEYTKKAGLNSRIARLGNVYGPEMDLSNDPLLLQIISDALYKDEIRVYGDGLEFMYYIFVTDAIQGILKALFSQHTSGQVYSLTNPEEISVLSIVNKILTFPTQAKRIKFMKGDPNANPLYERAYIPEQNLSEIGWKPTMPFERGLLQVYEYFRNYISQNGSYKGAPKEGEIIESDNLEFNFDTSINLADSVYSYPSEQQLSEENRQFREFQQKYNEEKSPIKTIKINPNELIEKHPYIRKENSKNWKKYSLWTLQFVIVLVVFVFLIIPGARVGLVYYQFDRDISKFSNAIKNSNYNEYFYIKDYPEDFENSLITVNWALKLSLNTQQGKMDILDLMDSYEDAINIYNEIQSNDLKNTIMYGSNINSNTLEKMHFLVPDIKTTIQGIEKYSKSNFSDAIKSDFNTILNWLKTLLNQIELRISDA